MRLLVSMASPMLLRLICLQAIDPPFVWVWRGCPDSMGHELPPKLVLVRSNILAVVATVQMLVCTDWKVVFSTEVYLQLPVLQLNTKLIYQKK